MSGHSDLGFFNNFGASSIFTWVSADAASAACPAQPGSHDMISMTFAAVICDGNGNGLSWRSLGHSQDHTLKKKNPTTSQHGPLSARTEQQSHPRAGQAQACGIRRMDRGPDGTC